MNESVEKLRNLVEIARKYRYLDLKNFISMSLSTAGYDLSMMDNVYIDEIVKYPGVFGVYDKEEKMYSYACNDRAEIVTKEYTDPGEFMAMFVQTAPHCEKAPTNSNFKK